MDMEMSRYSGLRFPLKGVYRATTISPEDARKCWEQEFQYPLRVLAGTIFPEAVFRSDGNEPHVVFREINGWGIEILKGSKSLGQRVPPSSEVRRVQEVIERIHRMADDPAIPWDRREFFRNLQLPDPAMMPECWRVTGFFKRRLHVIWGLAKEGQVATFLPASRVAERWGGAGDRISVLEALKGHHGTVATGGNTAGTVTDQDGTGVPGGPTGKSMVESSGGASSSGLEAGEVSTSRGLDRNGAGGPGAPGSICAGGASASSSSGTGAPRELESRRPGGHGAGRGCLRRLFGLLGGLALLFLLFHLLPNGCRKGDGRSVPSDQNLSDVGTVPPKTDDKDIHNLPPGSTDVEPPMASGVPAPDLPPGSTDVEPPMAGGVKAPDLPPGSMDMKPPRTSGVPKSNMPLIKEETRIPFSYRFKVLPAVPVPEGGTVAKIIFKVVPEDDLVGRGFVVSDWSVNGMVQQPGTSTSATFMPAGGLRFDKSYTISAVVKIDGQSQRVEPYQWNMVDGPTWQILEVGRSEDGEKRQFRLVCCNSSSVQVKVKDWRVSFRPGGKNESRKLGAFNPEKKSVGNDMLELDWGIGRYKGTYFLELTADIQYTIRNDIQDATHHEVFPFTHDSSADGLTRAKYEKVIPNVYFCLARLDDGALINGTAFAISEKLLLSNYHVAVGNIPETYGGSADGKVVGPVTLTNVRGDTYHARVVQSDRARDLVLLQLCSAEGKDVESRLPGYLHLSEDKIVSEVAARRARHVFAIGYPRGTVCKGPPAFTDGKAEEVYEREYCLRGRTKKFGTIVNYTNTQKGYSGGPLIDYQTETVLGVNFGGLVPKLEGHKAASLATSSTEVRLGFPNVGKK